MKAPWSIERVVAISFAALVAVIAVTGFLSARSIRVLVSSQAATEASRLRLEQLTDLFALLADAETAERGFVITGDEAYLAPFHAATNRIPILSQAIANSIRSEIEAARWKEITSLVSAKLAFVQACISLRQQEHGEEAMRLIRSDQGFNMMQELRRSLDQWKQEERERLTLRERRDQAGGRQATLIATLAIVLNLLLVFVVFGYVRVELKRRRAFEAALEEARDVALQSHRQKSEFLAEMSREIRTPMNGVLGMANMLLDTRLSPEQQVYAATARDSAEALQTILDDILDFSKIEAGRMTFEPAEFDLRDLVEGVVQVTAQRAQSKGLEVAFHIATDVPENLLGDSLRLRQVLLNLVGNAIQFTQSGEVVVRVQKASESTGKIFVRFSVSDTGSGIAPEKQVSLFRAFDQADASTTRQYDRSGLGLVISKSLVELMGGQIGVRSEEGEGSEFWFTIPFEVPGEPNPKREETGGSGVA